MIYSFWLADQTGTLSWYFVLKALLSTGACFLSDKDVFLGPCSWYPMKEAVLFISGMCLAVVSYNEPLKYQASHLDGYCFAEYCSCCIQGLHVFSSVFKFFSQMYYGVFCRFHSNSIKFIALLSFVEFNSRKLLKQPLSYFLFSCICWDIKSRTR